MFLSAIGLTCSSNYLPSRPLPPPYSPLGEETLHFARQTLEQRPEILPTVFRSRLEASQTHQPINKEIALLSRVFWETTFKNFKEQLRNNLENPWDKKEVIEAADDLMKIGFAVSSLTLDELPAFTENLSLNGVQRSYAEALTTEDSYPYRTFYHCSTAYHLLRGAAEWSEELYGAYYPNSPIPENHVVSFYEEGTIKNTWNVLYNEYCRRVRMFVADRDLRDASSKHADWTEEDTGVESFACCPTDQ